MTMTATVLRALIQESKDGEWGKGDPFADAVQVAVIRGTDFDSTRVGDIQDLPIRYIPERIASRKILRANDILIETAGGSTDRPTGRSLLVKPSLIQRSTLPLTCASFSRFIRIDSQKADPRYIFWYLQYLYATKRMWQYSTRHTGVARFQFTVFSETEEFVLPPLPTQRKIAAILSAYDDLIENNTRRIALLEEMARRLYHEWFVRFRFPGYEAVRLVDSSQGPIPKGWEAKSLGDLATEVRRGVEPSEVEPEAPYVGLEHLPRRSIALSEWGMAKDAASTKLAFREGEILFGKIRPYFHKVVVAPVDGICSTDAIVILPKTPDYFPLILSCVSSDSFVEYATRTSQGTKMPRTDWKVLVKYPVVIPPRQILLHFNDIIQDSIDQIHNLIRRNRNLRRTRDLLLPRLVSGVVDVSDLDIAMDE
jgi:type I restriction enzyme S subunit